MEGSEIHERLGENALNQHRDIRFFLDRLRSSVAALDPEAGGVGGLRDLVAEIESFKERLEEHHQEEETGLFQAIADALPDLETEIHRLTAEHGRMIEILEMARIHAQNDRASDIAALREDLQQFLDTIQDHERAEETLIERATTSV